MSDPTRSHAPEPGDAIPTVTRPAPVPPDGPTRSAAAPGGPGSEPDGETVRSDSFADRLLRFAAGGSGETEPTPPPLPQAPSGYVIERELSHGGMGVVYLARQTALSRPVALKVLLAGGRATVRDRVRFLAEAEAVAAIDDPRVVKVYDFGQCEGQPYLAMEYVPGGTLAGRLKAAGALPPREAAGLVLKVARGVAAAHARGIVHRDLKPANVLFGEDGEPKVADFGLAKRPSGSDLTSTQAVMGTPAYMAPEQARGDAKFAGPAADVWALGVILYECLTGRVPFRGDSQLAVLHGVLTEAPEPPRRAVRGVPRDLELVCLKCLSKEPRERYPSAAELIDDLEAHLTGRPVAVRAAGALERGWRWCRRNPLLAATQATAAALLVTLVVGLAVYADEQGRNAAAQTKLREDADAATSEAREAKLKADREAETARRNLSLAITAKRAAEARRYLAEMVFADRALADRRFDVLPDLLNRQVPRPDDPEDRRGFEWYYLQSQNQTHCLQLGRHAAEIRGARFDPSGERVISCATDGSIRVYDCATGRSAGSHAGRPGAPAAWVTISPDGRLVAASTGNGQTRILDVKTGKETPCQMFGGGTQAVAFDPTGSRLAGAARDGNVVFWDGTTGRVIRAVRAHAGPAIGVAFSSDGRRLACVGADKSIALLDADGDAVSVRVDCRSDTELKEWVAFSPDGQLIAAGVGFSSVGIWDTRTGRQVRRLIGHASNVWEVAFSPDGRYLATTSSDRTVQVWEVATGQRVHILTGHTATTRCVGFSPDGRRLVTGASDGRVHVWDFVPPPPGHVLARHAGLVAGVAGSPNFRHVASCGTDGRVKVWDVRAGRVVLEFPGSRSPESSLAFSPDGRLLAAVGPRQSIQLWDVAAGSVVGECPGHHDRTVTGLAFSPDGKFLASGGHDRRVRLWDVTAARLVRSWEAHTAFVFAVVFSPDGTRLATGGGDRYLRVWDTTTGREAFSCDNRNWAGWPSYDPRGRYLVSGGMGDIHVWDAANGKKVTTVRTQTKPIARVAFSPDGRRLFSVSENDTLGLWDTDTWQSLLRIPFKVRQALTFTPDGRLIVGGFDGRVVAWDGGMAHSLPGADDGRREVTLAWHRAAAAAAAVRGDLFAAGFHADREADLLPGDPAPCIRAARHWALAGQPARWSLSYIRSLYRDPRLGAPDLLADGSFEATPAAGWVVRSWRQNAAAARPVTDPVAAGRRSVALTAPSSTPDDVAYVRPVAVKPYTRYRLSGWVKTRDVLVAEKAGTAGATLSVYGGYERSRSVTGTSDWTYVAFEFDSGPRAQVELGPRLGHHGSTASGTAWFDDLRLVEVGLTSIPTRSVAPPPRAVVRTGP